jgi:Mannosyltransferase (PIG-V)
VKAPLRRHPTPSSSATAPAPSAPARAGPLLRGGLPRGATGRLPRVATGGALRSVSGRGDLSWGVRAAVVPWLVARAIVGAALVAAHEFVSQGKPSAAVATRVHEGLLGWDAGWYESIARHGYAGAGHLSLRFFPLVPLLTRALSYVPGVGFGVALVVVANVSAFVGVVLLAVLARRETGDDGLGRRAAWLMCLAPAAFTQVMGYAEGTLLALTVGTMLALRARAWWWAAALGLAAGATRPVGLLLVVPAAVEALRGRRDAPLDRRLGRAAAVLGPAAGFAAFLGWVGWRYGDALAPLRVQQQGTLRGGVTDPLRTFAHDASLLVHGRHLGSALHLPWALLALALLVVTLRSWPLAYGAFAAAVLVVALTASNLDGFERYALSAFPLVLAGATVTSGPRVERVVLTLAAGGLALYAVLAFTNLYVP